MVTEAEQKRALVRREELKQTAITRGRGFERREAIAFLGGAKGVSALRSARRKGLQLAPPEPGEELISKPLKDIKFITPKDIRKRTRQEILNIPGAVASAVGGGVLVQEDPILQTLDPRAEERDKARLQRLNELRFPIFVGAGGDVSAQDVKKVLSGFGLGGRFASQLVPETVTGLVKLTATGAALSSLAGVSLLSSRVTAGVIATLSTAGALDPSFSPEERILFGLVGLSAIIPPLFRFGKKKLPTFEQFKSSQSQFLRTKKGQQSFQQLETFFKKKGKKKSELQKILDDARESLTTKTERVGKKVTIRNTTNFEKAEFFRKAFLKIKETKNLKLRRRQAQGLIKFAKDTLGLEKSKNVFRELFSQERIPLIKPKVRIKPPVPVPTFEEAVKVSRFDVEGKNGVSELQKVLTRNDLIVQRSQIINAGRRKVELDRTNRNKLRNDQRIERAKSINAGRKSLVQAKTNAGKLRNDLRINFQAQRNKLRFMQSQRLNQQVNQQSLQAQISQQQQRTSQAQASLQQSAQKSAQALQTLQQQINKQNEDQRKRLTTIFRPRLRTRIRPPATRPFSKPRPGPKPKKKPKPKPFLLPKGKPKKKKVVKFVKKQKRFQAFGKISPTGLNKFAKLGGRTTLKKARKKLFGELDSTISASGFVKTNGKKIRLKNLPRGFRPSRNKKTPLLIIERKNKRLSSKIERKTIQQFKKLKKPFSNSKKRL